MNPTEPPDGDPQNLPAAEAVTEMLTSVLPPMLSTMTAFGQASRYLHPQFVPKLAELVSQFDVPLGEAQTAFDDFAWPDALADVERSLGGCLENCRAALDGFVMGAVDGDMMACFRSLRKQTLATECLYPMASELRPVSQFFLEEPRRGDEALLERLASITPEELATRGVFSFANGRDERGGHSLYVPESYDPEAPTPLIVALHGGSGHGADFVWTWVREARTRGMLVLSVTSQDRTWSLMQGPDVDSAPLREKVQSVLDEYNVDREQVLITGMSDGATYALLGGLQPDMPFTHFAPISGVLHPDNMMNGNLTRAVGKPVYLVHGELDWMFPVESAQMARDQLYAAGADVEYRQIEDLSHTYPREENARILDWMQDDSE